MLVEDASNAIHACLGLQDPAITVLQLSSGIAQATLDNQRIPVESIVSSCNGDAQYVVVSSAARRHYSDTDMRRRAHLNFGGRVFVGESVNIDRSRLSRTLLLSTLPYAVNGPGYKRWPTERTLYSAVTVCARTKVCSINIDKS